jgi:hypothetical protein
MMPSFLRLLAPLSVLVGTATGANAQVDLVRQHLAAMSGTLSVEAAPQMADGQLSGCALVFEHLQQDRAYLNGNFIRSSGSLGVMAFDGRVGLMLKLVTGELDPAVPDLFVGPLLPDRAYLVGSGFSSNLSSLVSSAPSDAPGSFIAIYPLDPAFETILEALQTRVLTVAFALQGGSLDVQLQIELDVVEVTDDGQRIRTNETTANFATCLRVLLESMGE